MGRLKSRTGGRVEVESETWRKTVNKLNIWQRVKSFFKGGKRDVRQAKTKTHEFNMDRGKSVKSKHATGKRKPHGWHRALRVARKRERMARKANR